jgi:FkbM family methyltransferase
MPSRMDVLRGYYHGFKAGIREQLKPRTTHVRLPGGSRFAIPRIDEIAERTALGTYEQDVVQFLRRALKPGMVAFDLGAHCGYFTLLMREAVGPGGQVHSFEPSPQTYKRLATNIRSNRYSNVFGRNAAVGAQPGSLTLNTYVNSRAAYSTFGTPPFPGSIAARVPVTSLDLYTSEHAIERVHLAKMDVEGSELEVLKGAQRLLEKFAVQVFVFEVSDLRLQSRGTSSRALIEAFRRWNYSLHQLDSDGMLVPFTQQSSYDYENLIAVAPGVSTDGLEA